MRKRSVSFVLAFSLLTAFALPTSSTHAAPPLRCTFTTSTNEVYPLILSLDQYIALTNLGQGGTTTMRFRGRTLTITNIGAETNQFVVTYDGMTVTGILSCQSIP